MLYSGLIFHVQILLPTQPRLPIFNWSYYCLQIDIEEMANEFKAFTDASFHLANAPSLRILK